MDSDYDELSALNDELFGSDTELGEKSENDSNLVKRTTKEAKLLLDVRLNMENEFKKGTKTRNTLWNIVHRRILEKDPNFKLGVKHIKRKFNNMLITYRRIRDRKSKTGRGNIHWTYFEEFDSVYSQRHDIEAPVNIVFDSSTPGNNYTTVNESSCELTEENSGQPKRIKRSGQSSVQDILKYWKEEDEKEDKRHAERMKIEQGKNDIEKEKNEIEREKTQCLKEIQQILSKLVRE